jgi:acylglycerol lipase
MNGREEMIRVGDNLELYSHLYESGKDHWLICVHGIGEHCDRHQYIVDLFRDRYNICLFDLRGHGRSEGRRTYIKEFRYFYSDLYDVIQHLQKNYKMKKFSLFGHSMGALICSGFTKFYATDSCYPEKVALNAPPVSVGGPAAPIVKKTSKSVVNFLCDLPFTIRLGGLVDLDYLSHDPMIKRDYLTDELVHKKPHSHLLLELVKASKYVFNGPLNYNCPVGCCVGSEDAVVDFPAVKRFFDKVETEANFKIIQGAYHETHFEIEKYRKPYFDWLRDYLTIDKIDS